MPGAGGIATCRETRRRDPRLQILMLTVRDGEADKIEALDAGADDFITKPFSLPELAARLRSAIRWRGATEQLPGRPIAIGEIELDSVRRAVRKGNVALRLTPKEFDLLHYLMKRPGVSHAHASLLQAVSGLEYGQELEYLRTFVHQLRKKIGADPSSLEYLLTEPHYGYRFRDAE